MNLADLPAAQRAALLRAVERTAVFGVLQPEVRAALMPHFEPLQLPGGQTLYERGEAADALYVLCAGALGVFGPGVLSGQERLLGHIVAGETVGEASLLTEQPRGTTVRALRDCSLLRLSRGDALRRLMRSSPEALVGALRLVLERMIRREMGEALTPPRTFALLPFDRGVPLRAVAQSVQEALLRLGNCLLIDADLGHGRDADWHSEREHEHRFVLYMGDTEHPAWRSTCLRQADELLLVAQADALPARWPDTLCQSGADALHRVRRLLLLGKDGAPIQGQAGAWLAQLQEPVLLHHLRTAPDYARLARLLAHRATGLVLSGGGARGFAHIGVLRALRELGRPVDVVGGTSMGAIVGAGLACEWDDQELLHNLRQTFVRGHPLSDMTVPLIAFTRGARTTRLLRRAFGERAIEDLALPFFCISSNLTLGCMDVHTRGPLWKWLRAGAAIPGILPPVLEAGMVHVDGAVMNNLPTDVMRERGIQELIAVDISSAGALRASFEDAALPTLPRLTWQWLRGRQWPSLFAILARAAMVHGEGAGHARRRLATHLLSPAHGNIGLLEWKSHERAIESGYRCAMDYFSRLEADQRQRRQPGDGA
jgi:NTE family protein